MKTELNFLDYFVEKFQPRQVQLKALNWLQENWDLTKTLALSAPCSSGKSAIGMAIARCMAAQGKVTAYITPQKMLQNQLKKDYPEINMLQGSVGYSCSVLTKGKYKVSVEEAKVTNMCWKCEEKEVCEYFISRDNCYSEWISIYNPMSYMFLPKKHNLELLYKPDVMILDECQTVAEMLSAMFDIKIWRFEIAYPKGVSGSLPRLRDILDRYKSYLETTIKATMTLLERAHIMLTIRKIDRVIWGLDNDPQNFVIEEAIEPYRRNMEQCIKVRVVKPPQILLNSFYGGASKIILMSGTLFKSTIKELGLENDCKLLDLPSPIPKENRRFLPLKAVSNGYSNPTASEEVAACVTKIAAMHPNEKGIVLCTYEQGKKLSILLKDDPRFISHTKSNKQEVIQDFIMKSPPDTIAILAGAWEGLDLKDDLCRFIIITKCLYPNIMDNVVIRRKDIDPMSYDLGTIETVIQGANRGTRHEKDFSITYMLDTNFNRLFVKTKSYLPQYFIESVVHGVNMDNVQEKVNEIKKHRVY